MKNLNTLSQILEEKIAEREAILNLSDLEFLHKIHALTTLSFEIRQIKYTLTQLN